MQIRKSNQVVITLALQNFLLSNLPWESVQAVRTPGSLYLLKDLTKRRRLAILPRISMLKRRFLLPLGLGGLGASGPPFFLPLVPVVGMWGELGAWLILVKIA